MNATIKASDLAALLRPLAAEISNTQRWTLDSALRDARAALNGLRPVSPHRREVLERYVRCFEALASALGRWAPVLELRYETSVDVQHGPSNEVRITRAIEGYKIEGSDETYSLVGLIDKLMEIGWAPCDAKEG